MVFNESSKYPAGSLSTGSGCGPSSGAGSTDTQGTRPEGGDSLTGDSRSVNTGAGVGGSKAGNVISKASLDAHAAEMFAMQMQEDELYAGMTDPFDGEDGKKDLDHSGQETKPTPDKNAKRQRKLEKEHRQREKERRKAMKNNGMISRDPWGLEADDIAADMSFEEEASR